MSDELVERVARAIAAAKMGLSSNGERLPDEFWKPSVPAAIDICAIALEEAAKVVETTPAKRWELAAAIRAMIPSGNDPAQDDTGNAK